MAKNWSKHHICPTSRWGQNVSENIVRLTNNVHVALHQVFNNSLPHEQIIRLLWINESALSEEFSARVKEITKEDVEWIYSKGVLVPK